MTTSVQSQKQEVIKTKIVSKHQRKQKKLLATTRPIQQHAPVCFIYANSVFAESRPLSQILFQDLVSFLP